jgi:hypothetical protein
MEVNMVEKVNVYNSYEDKDVKYVYEIVLVDGLVDGCDLFWTGDGMSSIEYAALRYKNKQTAIDIAKKLKEIYELQWGYTPTIAIGTIEVVNNLYIHQEEVE